MEHNDNSISVSVVRHPKRYPDQIILKAMAFYGYHGVNLEERKVGQPFTVDLRVYGNFDISGHTDDLNDTVNYSELYRLTKDVVEGKPHNLLESIAETIAERILASYKVTGVAVRVAKTVTPITGATLEAVAIELYRESPMKG